MKQLSPCDHDECPLTKCNMPTQQYPEHILKQADEMETKTIMRHQQMYGMTGAEFDYLKKIIRDTLNLPALLMAQEQLSQHQQVVKQLVEALDFVQKNAVFSLAAIPQRPWEIIVTALSTAKQLLEKKV